MIKKFTCISCPIGCSLTVDVDNLLVTGNKCNRGKIYGINEVTNPVRTITTTVKVEGGTHKVLPVKTKTPIPKGLNMECMKVLNAITVKAPVKIGDIIVKNILGTGVDIVATREMRVA